MGRGIIFVGGNENAKEAIEYKKGSKWKDNWGMYSYHPSKVKSNKRKKRKDGQNIIPGKPHKSKRNKKSREKTCYREVKKYANELHPARIRRNLSQKLHSKYSFISAEMIYRVLSAYYDCCTDINFSRKGQISMVKQNLEKYLDQEAIPLKLQQNFLIAENRLEMSN